MTAAATATAATGCLRPAIASPRSWQQAQQQIQALQLQLQGVHGAASRALRQLEQRLQEERSARNADRAALNALLRDAAEQVAGEAAGRRAAEEALALERKLRSEFVLEIKARWTTEVAKLERLKAALRQGRAAAADDSCEASQAGEQGGPTQQAHVQQQAQQAVVIDIDLTCEGGPGVGQAQQLPAPVPVRLSRGGSVLAAWCAERAAQQQAQLQLEQAQRQAQQLQQQLQGQGQQGPQGHHALLHTPLLRRLQELQRQQQEQDESQLLLVSDATAAALQRADAIGAGAAADGVARRLSSEDHGGATFEPRLPHEQPGLFLTSLRDRAAAPLPPVAVPEGLLLGSVQRAPKAMVLLCHDDGSEGRSPNHPNHPNHQPAVGARVEVEELVGLRPVATAANRPNRHANRHAHPPTDPDAKWHALCQALDQAMGQEMEAEAKAGQQQQAHEEAHYASPGLPLAAAVAAAATAAGLGGEPPATEPPSPLHPGTPGKRHSLPEEHGAKRVCRTGSDGAAEAAAVVATA